MSRSYKDAAIDDFNRLNGAGTDITAAVGETLSGADLMQLMDAARNGAAAGATAGPNKVLGTNAQYPGAPSNAALTGADLEKSAGGQ